MQVYLVLIALQYVIEGEHVVSILCFCTVVGVEQIIPCILLCFYSRSLSSVIEYGSIGTRYPRTWSPFVLDWELP